eukprot:m51a1_g7647 putative extracellular matrix protein fras1 (932) ;mRNA; f:376812-379799
MAGRIGMIITDSDSSYLGPPLDGSFGVTWPVPNPLSPVENAGFWTSPTENSNVDVLHIPLKNVAFKGPTVQLWYCEDWLGWTEEDNVGTVQFTYSVTYVPREPVVVVTNSIAVTQGVDLVITGSMIRAQGGSPLSFTVTRSSHGHFALSSSRTTPVTQFTQDDISAGRVLFVHDNSLSAPSYALTATDGHLTSPESEGAVTFDPANHPPVVVANAIAATEGVDLVLDSTMIRSTDQEGDAVAYTVAAVSHGHFAMVDSRSTPITHFEQSNIDSRLMVFVNDGLKETPSYTLVVSDGKESVTSVGAVTYTTVNMGPQITANALAITEGTTLRLTNAMVAARDIDSTPEQLTYSATGIANGWFARCDAHSTPVTSFTQSDIDHAAICFTHDGSAGAPSFTLVVSDGALSSAPSVPAVYLNHIPAVTLPIGRQPSCCYAVEGQAYSFVFANSTFVDVDGDALSYTATLSDGGPLSVRIVATDPMGAAGQDSLAIYFECAGLLHVDPQQFLEPPVVEVTLEGATLSIDLRLPQMIPHRSGVSAVFVNPTTQKPTDLTLPMPESPCSFGTVTSHNMWDLLRNADPDIRSDQQDYTVEFSVAVLWNETTVLAGHNVARPISATVSFVVRIHRAVSASSFIHTLDPSLVWAYVSKASAFPVRDASGTVQYVLMTVQMATVAAQEGYRIDPASFVVAGLRGAVLHMTQPALESSDAEVQRWSFTANVTGVCSLTASDGFTLDYTLVSEAPRSAVHSSSIATTFGHVESWCSVGNSTMGISAVQTTYASNSPTAGVVERFFVGDTVFVREAVAADATQSSASIVSVVLTGSAVRAGAEVVVFSEGTQAAAMQYALVACPSGVDAAACYSFVVDGGVLQAQGVLNVNTTMRLSLSGHKRTAQAGEVRSVLSSAFVSDRVGVSGACGLPLPFIAFGVVSLLF